MCVCGDAGVRVWVCVTKRNRVVRLISIKISSGQMELKAAFDLAVVSVATSFCSGIHAHRYLHVIYTHKHT